MGEHYFLRGVKVTTICFIGSGNLATAMIKGFADSNYTIHVSSPNVGRRHKETKNILCYTDNSIAIKNTDYIILAVKPYQINKVLKELKANITQQVIISLAAGISSASIRNKLSAKTNIFRAMPNIASSIKQSATTLFTDCQSLTIKNEVKSLFTHLGTVEYLSNEAHMDIATILAGSSPAFFYLFMHSLVLAAKKAGLEESLAEKLILQSCLGSAQLASNSHDDLDKLIATVQSRGGTTEAGLSMFTQHNFRGIVEKAFEAALYRAQTLANEFD